MSKKGMTHGQIWLDALISAIPVGIAIEWKDIQMKFFNRKTHFFEHLLVVLLGTAFTLYVFSYTMKLK